MARIRTIKPDFWSDEKIVELPFEARLFFIGTWNFADDNGNMQYSPKKLKMQIFPADSIDCEPIISSLIGNGLLSEYSVSDARYLHINGFGDHQVINRPSKTRLPTPESPKNTHGVHSESQSRGEEGAEPAAHADSEHAHGSLSESSLTEGKGKEGKGGLRHSSRRHSASDSAPVDNSAATTTGDDLNDHQNQNPQTSENDAGASGGARDDSAPTDDSAIGMAARDDGVSITFEWLKSVGVKVEPGAPLIAGWQKAGVTRKQIELGLEKCKPYKLNGVPAAYLASTINEMLNPPERAAKRMHVGNDLASVQAAARSIGLDDGRIGEQLPEYRQRVLEAMDKGRRAA